MNDSDSPVEGEYLPLLDVERYEGENLGGRPRLYEFPEDFDQRVNEYFTYCQNLPNEPTTITGLTLFMGFCSVRTLYNYKTYEGFLPSVERATTLIAYGYEKILHGANNAGAKFALGCIDRGSYWRPQVAETEDDVIPHEDRLAHLR